MPDHDRSDYIAYHDHMGTPEYDDRKLFAMLCPRGATGGLSWLTILKTHTGYHLLLRILMPLVKLMSLMNGRLSNYSRFASSVMTKGAGDRSECSCLLALQQQGISFSEWIWQFVGGKPVIDRMAATK